MDAEKECLDCQLEHERLSVDHTEIQEQVKLQYKELKRSINKSK